jgi:hypothetical protein
MQAIRNKEIIGTFTSRISKTVQSLEELKGLC